MTERDRIALAHTDAGRDIIRAWHMSDVSRCVNIGMVTGIYRSCTVKPRNNDEWVQAYYASGAVRLQKLADIYERAKKNARAPYSGQIAAINRDYGRTEKEIFEVSQTLAQAYRGLGKQITDNEVYNLVVHCVLDQVYKGIKREEVVEASLSAKLLPYGLIVSDPTQQTDVADGVDLEIRTTGGRIIQGIQVKGDRFEQDNSQACRRTKEKLRMEHARYTERTGAPVDFVYVNNQLQVKDINRIVQQITEKAGVSKAHHPLQRVSAIDKFKKRYGRSDDR